MKRDVPAAVPLSPADLQALHAVQLQNLLELDRVCRNLGLRYQLAAGTLLGAVRHQGFIPWDSDIDVVMPRHDFDRLLAEAPAHLDQRYFLQHRGSDPAFPKRIATLRRQNSEFRQVHVAHLPMHHGIHIDIMPFDTVVPDRWWGRAHLRGAWLARLAQTVLNHPHQGALAPHRPRWQHLLARLAYRYGNLIPKKIRGCLYDKWLRALSQQRPRYVTCLVSIPADWDQAKGRIRPLAEFEPIAMLSFEGHSFPAPSAYDSVLTRLYGDYMQLPPPDKRTPKHLVTSFRLPPGIEAALESRR